MSEILTPNELHVRFSRQFAKGRWRYEFYRGWFPLIASACADIEALVRLDPFRHRFQWQQIKEKFGTMRLYWRCRGMQHVVRGDLITAAGIVSAQIVPAGKCRDGLVAAQIREIVRAAEEESARTCMHCGARGELRGGIWWTTLCDEHWSMRQAATLTSSSFGAADDWQVATA